RESPKRYRLQKKWDVPKVLYQSTSIESYVEGESVEEKGAQSSRDDHSLERIDRKRPFKNVGDFHKQWTEAVVNASRATAHKGILDMGFKCRIPLVKPLQKNVAQWSKVHFSDESNFCISLGNQGPRVWRKNGEAHNA
ncbi:hypothetical protein JRQ81_005953, partial [Phrynocephalus forsythii]